MANQLILDRALDANGYIAPGAKATVYAAGTSTLITVYSDEAGGIVATNPIVADGDGFWPQRYVVHAAKVAVTDADDVALYTLDPVPVTQSAGSAASLIPFTPSVEVPENNVQDAIDYLAGTVASGFSTFGLGITGNATLLANIDATATGAGAYRFDATSTGTFPTGVVAADTGLIEYWRQTSAIAKQYLFPANSNRVFQRRMVASVWGAWREEVNVNQATVEGDLAYRGASDWVRLPKGSASQLLKMNSGATAPEWGSVNTTVGLLTTTGATSVGPWDLPAGVTRFRITSDRSSLSGTNHMLVQLRVGGSFVTSGYVSYSVGGGTNLSSTAGMIVSVAANTNFWLGKMEFELHDPTNHIWVATHGGSIFTGAEGVQGGGSVDLSAAVDGVRIISSGADTFDASSFNVSF